jgi:CBS domain-containing protein
MISVPRISVKKIARRSICISPKTSFHEGGEKTYKQWSSTGSVIMTCGLTTINSEEPIYEAIKMLEKMCASQLVVLENGMLWGIGTSGNLIKPPRG